MKTLLYATGETQKLLPLTEQIVSPMLPILNRPVMDYSIEVLARQRIKQIDISLFNKPGEIEAYFGDGKYRGLKLTYHLQREALGDAGSIRRAFPALDEPVLLMPADILIDLDLEGFLSCHEFEKVWPDGPGFPCDQRTVAAEIPKRAGGHDPDPRPRRAKEPAGEHGHLPDLAGPG